MRGKRGAVPLALAVVATGLAAAPASAVVSTIYVQNGFGANCSDTGAGSSAVPFCTISKAASVVQPGQTVMVGYGDYPETVTIASKGTAAAPIRFVGQSTPDNNLATWAGSDGGTNSGNHAFVINGAQYVTLTGFAVSGNEGAVVVQNAKNVTLDKLQFVNERGSNADVQVAGSASVALSNSWLEYGVELDAGTSGATIVQDVIPNGWLNGVGGWTAAIRATDAAATTIEGDTITPSCEPGIDLEGASTGSMIVNDIINTATEDGNPCGSTGTTPITVAATAASSTTADYNVVHVESGPLYTWSATGYSTVAAFSAATGQGSHDLSADPKLVVPPGSFTLSSVPYYPSEGSPEVDSGDAAHALSTDIVGLARVDDPLVTNTGSGTGYADRGAFEYQDPIAMVPMTVKQVAGGGPLDVSISSGVKAAWSNQIKYTYSFQDGSPQTVLTSGLTTSTTHDFARAGYQNMSVTATDGYASVPQNDQNQYSTFVLGADFTPMNPSRMLDTRKGIGAPAAAVAPNGDVTLTVGGINGIPTKGLSAVVMNVTVTQPTATGYLTVYPHGDPVPQASNVNFQPGQSVPNLVTTVVRDGKVSFHNGSGGTVQVIADVEGYYADSGYGFKSVAPVRVLDTRKAIGATKAPVPSNGHIALDLSSSVPAGTEAVTMNVTVTNPAAGGYLTVYPDGSTAPVASNLNFSAGQTVPNLVTVPVNNGKVDFQNTSAGTVDVVADLAGYYGDGTTSATAGLAPNDPERIWDTRSYGQTPGPVAANGTLHLGAGYFSFGSGQAPAAVILNVTVTGPTANGYLTVYPDGSTAPVASNLNFSAGQTVPNLVSVGFGADGVDFFNGSGGSTNIVVDMDGMFTQPLP